MREEYLQSHGARPDLFTISNNLEVEIGGRFTSLMSLCMGGTTGHEFIEELNTF